MMNVSLGRHKGGGGGAGRDGRAVGHIKSPSPHTLKFKKNNKTSPYYEESPKGTKVSSASGRRSGKRVAVEDLDNNRRPSPCML